MQQLSFINDFKDIVYKRFNLHLEAINRNASKEEEAQGKAEAKAQAQGKAKAQVEVRCQEEDAHSSPEQQE